ncbi:sugar ABC transporter ATP-binding protein [Faecalispora anaeroviscerum]|uniref:sugar ABC transporter ATP-binding protein n=1 Tax=Faecalispora anaeroviscerum TaxID=2991836 RepID=UPI0024BAD130|nr:sugar ABC transporter ATP-binding protein [Faecalispora anaeroviscerum]
MEADTTLLVAKGITKRFPGVLALSNVDFECEKGEVHALMGENGAGKSTLSKIIAGVYPPDEGTIYLDGQEVHFQNTKQAISSGISIVSQEFNLLPHLSVAENVFLTDDFYYYKRLRISNRKKMVEESRKLLATFGMEEFIDPYQKVESLSVAQKQIVEIIKAVSTKAKLVILDEPTATLSHKEVSSLFRVIRQLKSEGMSFIIVSHRINEVYEISDRITVLRDGKLVLLGAKTAELDQNDLIKNMVGREINDLYCCGTFQKQNLTGRPIVMEVRNMTDKRQYVKNISFDLREGEILGISGLVGAGRTELIRCVFGIDPRSSGTVKVMGKEVPPNSISASMRNSMGFVPDDRHQVLLQQVSVVKNICLAHHVLSPGLFINQNKEDEQAEEQVKKLYIKVANLDHLVCNLSGGNQQKVLLGKWLMLNPKILFVDEPTRGIDIAAKCEIYAIMKQLAASGVSIVMVSSEIPEILGVCDRTLIMRDGQLTANLDIEDATEEKIGYYATLGTIEEAV